MKLTVDRLAEIARFNAGVARAREAYELRDVPMFDDCTEPLCGAERTCHPCRMRAKRLLEVATSQAECASLLAIIDRPGLRALRPCGTLAAFRRHQRHGERPCLRCRQAYLDYSRGKR